MTAVPSALLFGIAALLLVGFAAWLYLGIESRVPGRPVLLGLRASALLLLLALVVNPSIPGEDPAATAPTPPARWVVVDPDPALEARPPEGVLWDQLLDRTAEELDPTSGLARIQRERAEGLTLEALRAGTPAERSTPAGEALIRLAEVGADSLVFLSTLRMEAAPLREALSRLPVPVRIVPIGGEMRNVAVAELRLPSTAPPDEPLPVEVVLVGEGGDPGDSVRLRIYSRPFDEEGGPPAAGPEGTAEGGIEGQDPPGTLEYEGRHALPTLGARETVALTLPAPGGEGDRRYLARAELEGDVFAADDERVRVVRIGELEGGIVLVSVRPDWEPRTLLPLLERASGLEGAGYLRVGPDRFLPLRSGAEPFEPMALAGLVERARGAAVLVLHGTGEALPALLVEVAEAHPRVLHLPADAAGARIAGIETRPPVEGEWRLDAELPGSPLSPYLGGIGLPALPPLTGVMVPAGPVAGSVAFRLRRSPAEEAHPGLVLTTVPAGRRAVALARDFWRWGVRDGEPRDAYRNLWSGVAGWLLASEAMADRRTIRPEAHVLPRAEPLPWTAAGWEGAALTVELRPPSDPAAEGPVIRRDSVNVGPDGRFQLAPLPPGRYRYRVLVGDGAVGAPDGAPEDATDDATDQVPDPAPDRPVLGAPPMGIFEVERFQGALLRPPLDPEELMRIRTTEAVERREPARGRPLRTHPLPWLLLLGFLAVEWIGRRRAGLR
ncbi:MAG: hypothetical protein EA351_15190 [Gemmatimonadales bacterium]|nr:MAG: hypothetical protein EA351_15190 [Gemmatimonadales bacterium]